MIYDDFKIVFDETIDTIKNLLLKKSIEYSSDNDKLANFKYMAGEKSPEQILFGYLHKHFVSVGMMCDSGKDYDFKLWEEKINDIIAYMLLLKAVIVEKGTKVSNTPRN